MDGEQTLEELTGKVARAWASIDGKAELFDKENGCTRYGTGTYVGYMADAEELLRRSGLSDAFKAMEAERDHVRFLANDAAERELAIEAENKKLRALIAIAQEGESDAD